MATRGDWFVTRGGSIAVRFYTAPPPHGVLVGGNITAKGVYLGPVHAVACPQDAYGGFLSVQVPHPDHPELLGWVNVAKSRTEFCWAVPPNELREWFAASWRNILLDVA